MATPTRRAAELHDGDRVQLPDASFGGANADRPDGIDDEGAEQFAQVIRLDSMRSRNMSWAASCSLRCLRACFLDFGCLLWNCVLEQSW